jgi:hypothetical protein
VAIGIVNEIGLAPNVEAPSHTLVITNTTMVGWHELAGFNSPCHSFGEIFRGHSGVVYKLPKMTDKFILDHDISLNSNCTASRYSAGEHGCRASRHESHQG